MAEGMSCDGGACSVAMGDCDGGGFDMGDMAGCDPSFAISNYHPVDIFQAHAAGDVVLFAGGLFHRPGTGNLQYVSESSPSTCYLFCCFVMVVVALTLGGIYLVPLFVKILFNKRN